MIVEIQGSSPDVDPEALRERLAFVMTSEGCENDVELSVLLTDDKQISDLHVRWMNIAGPTDVISFPLDDPDESSLGDVAVSLDTALRQANEHGHNLQTEVCLLCVHGCLHLLGYDDLTDEARPEMRRRERKYVPEAFGEGVLTNA